MIGAVTRRAMAVPVQAVLARQQSVQGVEQVVVGPAPISTMTSPAVAWGTKIESRPSAAPMSREERGAGRGQVGQATRRPGADRELARVYGKMLRSASRIRPRPPIAGADS